MAEFHLTDNDKASATWLRLRVHLEARLAAVRVSNDELISEFETALVRGSIRELKRLISLGKDRPVISDYEEQP